MAELDPVDGVINEFLRRIKSGEKLPEAVARRLEVLVAASQLTNVAAVLDALGASEGEQ